MNKKNIDLNSPILGFSDKCLVIPFYYKNKLTSAHLFGDLSFTFWKLIKNC